jgi:hypothetical protein
MPTVLQLGPYRFFFYSGDWQEPQHIHVERDKAKAKFWLNPVRIERSTGFSGAELNKIQRLVEDHVVKIKRSWDEYFSS